MAPTTTAGAPRAAWGRGSATAWAAFAESREGRRNDSAPQWALDVQLRPDLVLAEAGQGLAFWAGLRGLSERRNHAPEKVQSAPEKVQRFPGDQKSYSGDATKGPAPSRDACPCPGALWRRAFLGAFPVRALPSVDVLEAHASKLDHVAPVAPKGSVAALVADARWLGDVAWRAREALAKVGVPPEVVECLDLRATVLEGAQIRLRASAVTKSEEELALTDEAMRLRREIVRTVKFAARASREVVRSVAKIPPVVGLKRTLSDLDFLGHVAFDHAPLLAKAGVDGVALGQRAIRLSHRLGAIVSARWSRKAARAQAVSLRDRAAAWLAEAVREVKLALRYLGIEGGALENARLGEEAAPTTFGARARANGSASTKGSGATPKERCTSLAPRAESPTSLAHRGRVGRAALGGGSRDRFDRDDSGP